MGEGRSHTPDLSKQREQREADRQTDLGSSGIDKTNIGLPFIAQDRSKGTIVYVVHWERAQLVIRTGESERSSRMCTTNCFNDSSTGSLRFLCPLKFAH